jgi:hypothetical protein
MVTMFSAWLGEVEQGEAEGSARRKGSARWRRKHEVEGKHEAEEEVRGGAIERKRS